jgi:hypothetical protein
MGGEWKWLRIMSEFVGSKEFNIYEENLKEENGMIDR